MNTESTPPQQPPPPLPPSPGYRPPPSSKPPSSDLILKPMEDAVTPTSVIETLLKAPGSILHELNSGRMAVGRWLFVVALLSLGIFGLLLGTFSGGTQIWAAPAKIALGTFAAVFICLPSLYIFSALGGMEVRVATLVGIVLAAVGLMALLLLGFGPVVWVFSQSTDSVTFMGVLAVAFWMVALIFGLRLVKAAAKALNAANLSYLNLWSVIFIVVTLQMSTALRPIIGKAETLLPQEKKFFLAHWIEELSNDTGITRASKDRN